MRNRYLLLISALSVILCINAFAGILVKGKQTEYEGGKKTGTYEMTAYLEADRMRFQVPARDRNMVMIFRKDKEVFWMLDPDAKTYSEMTKEDMKKMKDQMNKAMQQMAEQMKNMPAEQRKMMEQMMAGKMPGAQKEEKITYKKTRSEKVNKWDCAVYEGTKGGQKVVDLWTASWSEVGFDRKDFAAFESMGEFFSTISDEDDVFMRLGSEEWEEEEGYAGFPVRTRSYQNGQLHHQTEMTEFSRQSLDSGLFEIPAGFKKTEGPWGRGPQY